MPRVWVTRGGIRRLITVDPVDAPVAAQDPTPLPDPLPAAGEALQSQPEAVRVHWSAYTDDEMIAAHVVCERHRHRSHGSLEPTPEQRAAGNAYRRARAAGYGFPPGGGPRPVLDDVLRMAGAGASLAGIAERCGLPWSRVLEWLREAGHADLAGELSQAPEVSAAQLARDQAVSPG